MPNGWCQQHAQLGYEHWVLDGPPISKTVGFCDLLGTPYAPVSEIPNILDTFALFIKEFQEIPKEILMSSVLSNCDIKIMSHSKLITSNSVG